MLVKWSKIAYMSPFSIPPGNFLIRTSFIPSVLSGRRLLMHSWILYLHLINSSRVWRTALKLDNSGLLLELEHSGCGQGLIDIFPLELELILFLLIFFFSAWFLTLLVNSQVNVGLKMIFFHLCHHYGFNVRSKIEWIKERVSRPSLRFWLKRGKFFTLKLWLLFGPYLEL